MIQIQCGAFVVRFLCVKTRFDKTVHDPLGIIRMCVIAAEDECILLHVHIRNWAPCALWRVSFALAVCALFSSNLLGTN